MMFSRTLLSILLLSMVNQACYAKRLRGCGQFSDRRLTLPASAKEVVVVLSPEPTNDLSFIPIAVAPKARKKYLVLESCNIGAKALNVINENTYKDKVNKYKEKAKELKLDFESSENDCVYIANIKSQIKDITFAEPDESTLYLDLAKKNSTKRRAIKRFDEDFDLVDDCDLNGEFADFAKINNIIHAMDKGMQHAIKVKFSGNNNCQKLSDIAQTVLNSLKKIYQEDKVQKLNVLADELPTKNGQYLRYKDKKFAQVDKCDNNQLYELNAITLEDVLDTIINSQIEMVERTLKSSGSIQG